MNILKKISFLFLLVSVFIPKTYAATIWNWTDGEDLKRPSELYFARCTSERYCSDLSTMVFDYNAETGFIYQGDVANVVSEYQIYSTTDYINFTANDYGVLVYFRPDQALQQNYMYSLTYYLCSSGSEHLQSIGAFTGKNLNQIMWQDYPVITHINGSYVATNRPFNNQNEPIFNTCTKYMYTFTSTSTRNYIGIKLNTIANSSQDVKFMGYNLVNLGFTDYAKQGTLQNIQQTVDSTNQEIGGVKDEIGQTNDKLDDLNDNITNNDITGSQNTANGFFDDFTDNDYGLSSIITIPLTSIQKITNASCSPLRLPIPFVNKTIDLPCMYDIYNNVPTILNIWQIVSFGLISYAIIVDIFAMVKKFKDPNDDKLEVMDL